MASGEPTQGDAPYLDAIRAHAARNPARLYIPGHKGGAAADGELLDTLGLAALRHDIPALTWGIDIGPVPTPFEHAQRLAAQAWGARRSWFLVNGASQGNLAAGLSLAHYGERVVLQRNGHSSTIDALVLSGMRPTFVAPEIDEELGIAHCITPRSLDGALSETPGAVAACVVSPTYFGSSADVRGLAEVAHAHDVPLVVDEAWGAHFAFHESLPEHALAAGADLVISSTHKIVGSLTQSAMLHLGGDRLDAEIVDRTVTVTESTSPNALLCASLDAARRRAVVDGRALIEESAAAADEARAEIRAIPGLDVLDQRFVGRAGVFGYDPLRLAVDVRGLAIDGYALARRLRERFDIYLELAAHSVVVGVFGMGGEPRALAERFVSALRSVAAEVGLAADGSKVRFAPAPPWGELVMTPREAFLGAQEVLAAADAVGRIAAESLATYPPGIPNVLPGERLTAETLAYIQRTLELGGSIRGASDRLLRTVRVVAGRG
ncbi:MAG TPA: DegT/DnrJ/EryC1/StrS family aminotransferase [Solirubrobacteraceae bacterium]|jgi:lysine decarboxylase